MPEAVEIYDQKNALNTVLEWPNTSAKITSVEVLSGRYLKTPIPGLQQLLGTTLAEVTCKGKLTVFKFCPDTGDRFDMPLFGLSTCGMTGFWCFEQDTRKNARLVIKFKGLPDLVYFDQRNFGTFKVAFKNTVENKLNELGPEPIRDHYLSEENLQLVKSRIQKFAKKKSIGEAMLDQRIFCGIGNYLRADACYYCRVDPRCPATSLDDNELCRLWSACAEIIKYVLLSETPQTDMFGNLFPEVIGTDFKRNYHHLCYGRQVCARGLPVTSYKDKGGRTMWYSPEIQK